MSLFVVRHQHPAEKCPAGHPQMAPLLLRHLSEGNAAKAGIKVHGDAVIDGGHIFYLILEGQDEATVREFMTPFAQAGTVEIWPANSCEQVVARARC